jgi:Arc/MetJ-type ribon-helix-helix transcriptional regulator
LPASYVGAVKAVTINISLNPELAEFARADSQAQAFDSMSEYMRDLIRQSPPGAN